jgi:hypothetical protein
MEQRFRPDFCQCRHPQQARKPYLNWLHRLLHEAASTVHCATQDPDSPQFCAQEKLAELQLEMHSAKSRV